ncbi:hypothetical protein KI387_027786, partial [Taxus chinensis]
VTEQCMYKAISVCKAGEGFRKIGKKIRHKPMLFRWGEAGTPGGEAKQMVLRDRKRGRWKSGDRN